jgi:hypothetical protein
MAKWGENRELGVLEGIGWTAGIPCNLLIIRILI